jgi:hypothetical protein
MIHWKYFMSMLAQIEKIDIATPTVVQGAVTNGIILLICISVMLKIVQYVILK